MSIDVVYKVEDGYTVLSGSVEDFGQVVARRTSEVDTLPRKLFLENVDVRRLGATPFSQLELAREQIGANDGITMFFTAEDPTGTLSRPWGLDLSPGGLYTGAPTVVDGGAGGVWSADGFYGVVVTAVNGNPYASPYVDPYTPLPYALGETPGSVEKVFQVDAARKKLYSWEPDPGASGYNVYRTPQPGTYDPYTFLAHVVGTSFLDAGHATTVGEPPVENTTGASAESPWGDPPAAADFDGSAKLVAVAPAGLAVGQQWVFWVIAKVPAGSTKVGNKRAMRLVPSES